MALKHVNAVIVGAGAGGGVVAKELAEAGLSVVLLERGGWVSFETHGHDELLNQRTTVLGNSCGPDDRSPRVIVNAGGKVTTVHPHEGGYGNNAACVGSGTVTYGAMAWRFLEKDFRMFSTYGALAGSTLDDWPITYDDLEPFYEKAEYEIGVAGDMSANPFSTAPPQAVSDAAFAYNREGRLLDAAGRRLGFHPFPIPMLRNSVPYGGRNACVHNRYCVGFPCPNNAKNGTQNTVIPRALATGLCELRTNSIVSEVVVDDHGRARGVKYFDASDRAHYQTADLVVVAGAAIETARLLLNSKSKLFPDRRRQPPRLGRPQSPVARLRRRPRPLRPGHLRRRRPRRDDRDQRFQPRHSPASGAAAPSATNSPACPTRSPTPARPAPRAGARRTRITSASFSAAASTSTAPCRKCRCSTARVQVDPTVKDHWGIPVARLSGGRHPHDLELGRFLAGKAELWLKAAGAIRTWQSLPGLGQSGGQHQAGTCRMGTDPKTSVTNKHGQVHDIPNLFLADGSLHVTNGGFNPALTIMALGYWVADYIKAGAKTGKFT
jgi:choline dehydrogenase-like flavoprotein